MIQIFSTTRTFENFTLKAQRRLVKKKVTLGDQNKVC